jgi:hypothetical protein
LINPAFYSDKDDMKASIRIRGTTSRHVNRSSPLIIQKTKDNLLPAVRVSLGIVS